MPFREALPGAIAVLWIALLWYAAPVLAAAIPRPADRLRHTIYLAVAIPFVLGFADLLYPAALAAAGLLAGAVRVKRHGWRDRTPQLGITDAAAASVIVALVWPVAVRPILDGDTLGYHLPNAASWIATHGIWTSVTEAGWYPPGSELAASALWALAGARAVGWAGLLPAALLLARMRTQAIDARRPAAIGLALGGAVIATAASRQQLFSLQNDLWLAAFFVEAVAVTGTARWMTALLKPQGALLAFVASARDWRRAYRLWWIVPLGLFVAHDRLIYHAATSATHLSVAGLWPTTIAANMPGSLLVALHAIVAAGPSTALCFAVALAALTGRYRIEALGAMLVFLFIPWGYADVHPQLGSGQSLRYALPFLALGMFWITTLQIGVQRIVAAIAAVCIIVDANAWRNVFWNDASTHGVLVAAVAAAVLCYGIARIGPRAAPAYLLMLMCGAALCANSVDQRAPAYLTDTYERGAANGGAFAWLIAHPLPAVLTAELPSGAAVLVLPHTSVVGDLNAEGACVQIAALHAAVVARHAAYAEQCGLRKDYDDGQIQVFEP